MRPNQSERRISNLDQSDGVILYHVTAWPGCVLGPSGRGWHGSEAKELEPSTANMGAVDRTFPLKTLKCHYSGKPWITPAINDVKYI